MRFPSLVVLVVLIAGCSGPPTGLAADLPGTTWTVERVVRADGMVLRGGDDQVTFGPDGALTLSSCNACNGRYRMRGGALRVEEGMACTKRACPDTRIELERYVAGELTVRLEGQYLIIEGAAETDAPTAQVLLLPEGGVPPSASGDSEAG